MSVPTTDDELLASPHFHRFLRETYSELPLEEVIFQFKGADPQTKRLIRLEFFEWLRRRGVVYSPKTSKEGVNIPMPV